LRYTHGRITTLSGENMKLPTLQIPLSLFAAIIIGTAGVIFEIIGLENLPISIRGHGFVSMATGLALLLVVVAGLILVFSVGLALRKEESRSGLVYSLLALLVLFLGAVVYAIIRKHTGATGILRYLLVFLYVAGNIICAILFLLNKPLIEELGSSRNLPDQAAEPTRTSALR
jgi:uncharacterized membrane protein